MTVEVALAPTNPMDGVLLDAMIHELYSSLFNYFSSSGGVLTGSQSLNVVANTPILYLSPTGTGQGAYITARDAGTLARWTFGKDTTAESGSNAGSDFFVNSYNDAGSFLATPFTIKRANGNAAFSVGADWTGGFAKVAALQNVSTGRTVSTWNGHNSAGSAFAARVDFTACRLAEFFYTAAASVGTITTNGTTTAYNTSSDRRLKTNIADAADDADAVLDTVKVRRFDWRSNGAHERFAFVAQELAAIVPEAVHAGDDGDVVGRLVTPTIVGVDGNPIREPATIWGVDNSKLVPLLVRSGQQQRARIAALEARLIVVEARLAAVEAALP